MDRPIGIFDSGVGGLTVAREVFRLLPAEDVVYFGDVGRTPYGGRSKEIIIKFTAQDIAFLVEQDVKFIICACNSASSVALEVLAPNYKIPMIGVIGPGADAAVSKTKTGRIGVIGTRATINSNAYANLIHAINPDLKVFSLACPLFVPLAEEGYIDKEATYMIARDYLRTMLDVEVDTLILGCHGRTGYADRLRRGNGAHCVPGAGRRQPAQFQNVADAQGGIRTAILRIRCSGQVLAGGDPLPGPDC
jgi:glutamate racemase